ncbi:MAG: hypothetical protein ACK5NT_14060 [Pyrinomonadaceae bacterium]
MKGYTVTGIIILFVLINLSVFTFGQDSILTSEERLEIGNRVISDSRKAIYGKLEPSKISGYEVAIEGETIRNMITTRTDNKSRSKVTKTKSEEGAGFFLPDQGFGFHKLSELGGGTPIVVATSRKFNGDTFTESVEMFRDGKRIDLASVAAMLPASVSSTTKGEISNLSMKSNIAQLKRYFWELIYPIILDAPWDPDTKPVYIYRGKAKVGETECDLVELNRGSTDKVNLFFDQSTKLLVLLTIESATDTSRQKTSYYYSDFSLMEGITIAKQIAITSVSTNSAPSRLDEIASQESKTQTKQKVVKFKMKFK